MEHENWLPIPGYEGAYEVSNQGRVRSVERRVRLVTRSGTEATRLVPARILRPGCSKSGHVSVALGNGNSRLVHQLVLEAFVGKRPEGCEALHADGNPENNALSNLRWGTRSENLKDIFYQKGRRLTREQLTELRRRAERGFAYGERYQLAKAWGVNSGTIHHALSGKQYGHVK